ncbi:MAG TPA: restriction endonuclease [Xanthomonadaceae bacterium]|nr:restriction endonuclease [Xanthomonadaceae bacterium]
MNDFVPLFALGAALAAALIAYLGLGLNRRRRLEARAGLAGLHSMKWREFAQLVGDLMRQRGLHMSNQPRSAGEGGFDLKFERGNQCYLVQIKHGGATHVGAATMRDLRAAIATEGAGGGMVVTSGAVDADVRPERGAIIIEILHGEGLWKELKPLLPVDLCDSVSARIRRLVALRWSALALAAVLAGGVVLLVMQPDSPAPVAVSRAPVVPPAPVASAPPGADPLPAPVESPSRLPDQAAAPPVTAALREVPVLTEAQAHQRRVDALAAVQSLEGVDSASWATRSTLVLTLSSTEPELRRMVSERVCERLVEYEELRYTRLQIQEGEDRVRWAQCQ